MPTPIVDQDELDYIKSQISKDMPPPAGNTPIPDKSDATPIVDQDELDHVKAQLNAAPQPLPTVTIRPIDPSHGQTMQARPEKTWGETFGDFGRMLASKIPFSDRAAAAMDTLVPGTGPGNGTDYATNLRDELVATNAVAHDYPILSKILGIGGGAVAAAAVLPESVIGATIASPTMLARTAYSAGTGGVLGGLEGVSSAPDLTNAPDVVDRAARGFATGTITGTAVPILGKTIGAGYGGAANYINGGVDGISRRAAAPLLSAMGADRPEQVRATLDRLGPQGMLADAGDAFLGKAQGAVLNSDEGRAIVTNVLRTRDEGRNLRIKTTVDNAFGQAEDPNVVRQSILALRSQLDNENYPAAFRNSPPVDSSVPVATVGQLLAQAVPGTLEHKALTNLRGMLMDEREVPMMAPNGIQFRDGHGNPLTEKIPIPRDNPEQLHKIKGEIDSIINYDAPGLGVPAGALKTQQGALKLIRGQINESLENQVPGYAAANAASSALAKRAEAVDAGVNALDSGKTAIRPSTLESQFAKNSPGVNIAFAKGTRGEVDRILGTKENDLLAGKNIIKGEGDWNRDRLATIFGPENADAVISTVGQEAKFADTLNKVAEGSQTEIRRAAREAMKPEAATGGIPYINPNMTSTGALMTPAKKLGSALLNQFRADPLRSHGEIARVVTAQGPQRDAYTSALIDALMRRNANSVTGQLIGNRSAIAAALIGAPYLNDQLQLPTGK